MLLADAILAAMQRNLAKTDDKTNQSCFTLSIAELLDSLKSDETVLNATRNKKLCKTTLMVALLILEETGRIRREKQYDKKGSNLPTIYYLNH